MMSKLQVKQAHMKAAASAEAAFSCANDTAMTMGTTLLVSILFAILRILGLRLRSLLNLLGLHSLFHLKVVEPTFA